MPTQPLISFIVPVYKVPDDMLSACLQSIFSLQLTASEREVIVVDDGNQHDITHSWCDEWRQSIVLIRQANQGLSKARNVALDVAHAQYIQMVDADDYLLPHIYNPIIQFVRTHLTDVFCFNFTQNEQAQHMTLPPCLTTGTNYMLANNMRSVAWGYLYNRSTLGHLRFTEGIVFEDVEFTTHVFLSARRVYVTQAQPYYYRVRQGAITSKQTRATYVNHYLPTSEQILYRLQRTSVTPQQSVAMQRRLAQLTMDHVYNVMRYTHSVQLLNQTLKRFKKSGLYPFPNAHYTRKYTLFRWLVQCPITRIMMTYLLK